MLFYRRISIKKKTFSENAYARRANGNSLTTLVNTYTLTQFFEADKFQPIPNKLELFTLQLCIIFCCRRSCELTYGELLLLLLSVFCSVFFFVHCVGGDSGVSRLSSISRDSFPLTSYYSAVSLFSIALEQLLSFFFSCETLNVCFYSRGRMPSTIIVCCEWKTH